MAGSSRVTTRREALRRVAMPRDASRRVLTRQLASGVRTRQDASRCVTGRGLACVLTRRRAGSCVRSVVVGQNQLRLLAYPGEIEPLWDRRSRPDTSREAPSRNLRRPHWENAAPGHTKDHPGVGSGQNGRDFLGFRPLPSRIWPFRGRRSPPDTPREAQIRKMSVLHVENDDFETSD